MIVPVAATGGAAAEIWKRLHADGGGKAARLSDAVFGQLGNLHASIDDACAAILTAISSACGKP
ncbi:hypothetical protein [Burkholderia glumae]|uniref:hypothetical protein n=1 Tax=Burkholderia glumae TaxID=337 RepID=UPI003BA8D714